MLYEPRVIKDRAYWLELKKDALLKHASGKSLTLEETAAAIWNPDAEPKPMTAMGVLKIENKALAKLKSKLKEINIKNLDDVFESRSREYSKPVMPEI